MLEWIVLYVQAFSAWGTRKLVLFQGVTRLSVDSVILGLQLTVANLFISWLNPSVRHPSLESSLRDDSNEEGCTK